MIHNINTIKYDLSKDYLISLFFIKSYNESNFSSVKLFNDFIKKSINNDNIINESERVIIDIINNVNNIYLESDDEIFISVCNFFLNDKFKTNLNESLILNQTILKYKIKNKKII